VDVWSIIIFDCISFCVTDFTMDDLGDMTLQTFKLWSIHALKVFLAKRDRPVTGSFDELVARSVSYAFVETFFLD